jgi:hypothetical protein
MDNVSLRRKIKKFMVHSRDHLTMENSRCRKGKTCTYGFPHPITPQTWVDDEGRVHYKRSTADDAWISPHIPELIDELECHIYVDVVTTIAVFAYLYKYLFKGPDFTWFRLSADQNDELINYVNARYLCATEGVWRILGFDITTKEPSVACLPVHLPGGNISRFTGGQRDQPRSSTSLLLRYFHRPLLDKFENITYIDYFQQYILYKMDPTQVLRPDEHLEMENQGSTQNKVCPRRNGVKVARLQMISPTAGELFYLRCLLARRPARSYRDLRTIDGETFQSYHETAVHLGLFSHQNEGRFALLEAVACYCTPAQLRFLFSRIIIEGFPARDLWNEFAPYLARDFTRRHSEEIGHDLALQSLASLVRDGGRSLRDYGMPEPRHRTPDVIEELERYASRKFELRQTAHNMYTTMNDEQKDIYITTCADILKYSGDSRALCDPLFIEGRPGRGKTFVVDAICSEIRGMGLIVLIVGTSALAATLYEGGRTAHNLFQIPVTEVSYPHSSLDTSLITTGKHRCTFNYECLF